MSTRKMTGFALAAAAAAMFAGVSIPASAAEEAKVHCEGVNACKGKSACKTAASACKGLNSCKGKGWVEMSQKDCDAAKAAAKTKAKPAAPSSSY